MASLPSSSSFPLFPTLFFLTFMSFLAVSLQQHPGLDSAEQEAVYRVLDSVNSEISWRTLYPDDLCSSSPHGVVCDYFYSGQISDGASGIPDEVHVTELSFGYVSDYTQNPPCSTNATLSPLIFSSFKYLRKLFFYKCFTETRVSVPDGGFPAGFGSELEEMVFIENPALIGPVDGMIGNFPMLRRLVLTGNGIYGAIPDRISDLVSLQEIRVSRNSLSGRVPQGLAHLENLKILDLSHNFLDGNVPENIGNLSQLLKLDLSFNGFSGKIPDDLGKLQKIEFLDLSFNRFGNFGVPLFLGDMVRLKEVYLSGNGLGGQIPDIWENLKGVLGIGFSGMGLKGKIPVSMGSNLRNLCYLSLDNNKLEGDVPEEFGLLENACEINLENNNLSGRVPFSKDFRGKIGKKLRLGGNPLLCVDKEKSGFGELTLCSRVENSFPALVSKDTSSSSSADLGLFKLRKPSQVFLVVAWLFMLFFSY